MQNVKFTWSRTIIITNIYHEDAAWPKSSCRQQMMAADAAALCTQHIITADENRINIPMRRERDAFQVSLFRSETKTRSFSCTIMPLYNIIFRF